MRHEQHEWAGRIKACEREFLVMRLAVEHLRGVALPRPDVLRGAFRVGDIDLAASLLESTYVVRLYAVFESGLRSFWETARDTHPPMRQLLDSIASSQAIPYDDLENAHKARRYRNTLVHEGGEAANPVALPLFRRHLTMYLRHLPPSWGG